MKKYVLLMIFICIVNIGLGQSYKGANISMVKDVFQAPPDVMAFQKVNMIPISLYTGKATVNVPIYEIDLEGIKIPISLTYNTGGVRVNDVASSVGLGWNLNAGGYITKEVKDIDDNALTYDQIVVPDDTGDNAGSSYYLLNTVGKHRTPWQKITRTDGTVLDITKEVDKQDAIHDVYSINAPDINGNFIIENITPNLVWQSSNGKNSYNVNIPYLDYKYKTTFLNNNFIKNTIVPLKREKIEFPTKNLGTSLHTDEFNSFSFKNEKGLIYNFGLPSFRASRPNLYSLFAGLGPGDSRPIFLDKIATSWPLERIESVNGKYIEFKYQRNITSEPIIKSSSITKEVGVERDPFNENFYFTELRRGPGPFYPFYYRTDGSVGELKIENTNISKLSQINFDKGSIHFYYDLVRQDLPGEKALTKIVIKDYNNQPIKSFRFYYKYVESSSDCYDYLCKRLFLTRVSEMDESSTLVKSSYTFTYNEEVKLPTRYSLEQDYLGFYNQNGQTEQPVAVGEEGSSREQYLDQHIPSPKLYYYPNQGKNSILPFKLGNIDTQTIPGDYSLEPDERYAFAGILTQMKFPTGATIDFKYELHEFNFKGESIKAGGARLKQQIIKDENNIQKTLNYRYEETNGKPSGYINNIPVYGYPNSIAPVESFTVYDTNKSGIEFTEGGYVGYSRVLEIEEGNGYTEYIYRSPKDSPNEPEIRTGQTNAENFLINNSAFPNLGYFDYDIKRGKLISKKIFNESKQLISSEENQYTYKKYNTINYDGYGYVDERDPPAGNYYDGGFDPSFYHHDIKTEFSLHIERNLLTKVESSEYFNNKEIKTSKELRYDDQFPLIEKEKFINSSNEVIETSYQYAHEKNNTRLINENRIGIPLQTTVTKGGTTVSDQLTQYATFGDLYLPQYIFSKKGATTSSTATDRKLTYDRYDAKGNLLQYHTEDGLYTSILWGYNGQYPIAKVEGARYDEISNYANNISGLRLAVPHAMVTTYTYEPLIGVTSITDPSGQVQNFTYDEFNRLEYVLDGNGKVIKRYRYNYEEQKLRTYGNLAVSLAGVSSYVLLNQSIGFSVSKTSGSNRLSYKWKINGRLQSTTGSTLQKTFNSQGNYTISVEVKDLETGQSTALNKTVSAYNPLNTPSLSSNYTYLVKGTTVRFTGGNIGNGSGSRRYEWYVNNTKQSGTGTTLDYNFGSTGTYTVKFRVVDTKIPNHYKEVIKTVYVYNPLNTPSLSSNYTYLLKGTTVRFTAGGIGNGSYSRRYEWYVNNTKQSGTSTTLDYHFGSTGTYTVKFRVVDTKIPNHYKEVIKTVYVYNPLNTPSISATRAYSVRGWTETFTAGGIGNGSGHRRYEWYVNNVKQSYTGTQFSYKHGSTGTYTVKFRVVDTRIPNHYREVKKSVNVYNPLNLPIVSTNYTYSVKGTTVRFTGGNIGGGSGSLRYEWYVNGVKQSQNSRVLDYKFNNEGTYKVWLKVIDIKISNYSLQNWPIEVHVYTPLNSANLVSTYSYANKNLPTTFKISTISGGSGYRRYEWYVNNIKQSYTGTQFSYKHGSTGTYTVKFRVVDTRIPNHYKWSNIKSITVINGIELSNMIQLAINPIKIPITGRYAISHTGGSGYFTKKWTVTKLGTGGFTYTYNNNSTNLSYFFNQSGDYDIYFYITDTRTGQTVSKRSNRIYVRLSPEGGIDPGHLEK